MSQEVQKNPNTTFASQEVPLFIWEMSYDYIKKKVERILGNKSYFFHVLAKYFVATFLHTTRIASTVHINDEQGKLVMEHFGQKSRRIRVEIGTDQLLMQKSLVE